MSYNYTRKHEPLMEPDWQRMPGWRRVGARQWWDIQWQRANCVKNTGQLRTVLGPTLSDKFYEDVQADQVSRATMPILLPPYVLNMMVPNSVPSTELMYLDPVRRHMLPTLSDRNASWPSHPKASRDSLHEKEMWVTEGLTHRYPNKVLAEIVDTCPQYCGHCTRMDRVGTSTSQIQKLRFSTRREERLKLMLDYLRRTPDVRDVVVSGGDVANLPWTRLECFLLGLLDIDHIRNVRLASKALLDLPQHWLTRDAIDCISKVVTIARKRGVSIAIHTQANTFQQLTVSNARAVQTMLEAGVHAIRNQGVLLRHVNDSAHSLLRLCGALLDEAKVEPYYFFMCDMIPNSEHWRLPLWRAQELQEQIMGYLPGFATPRIVCDVPNAGKHWVHQVRQYDRIRGISYWRKHFLTKIEEASPDDHPMTYEYYDPITSLPPDGQEWWSRNYRSLAPRA